MFYSILICTLIRIPLGVTTIPEGSCPSPRPIRWLLPFVNSTSASCSTLDMAVIIFTLLFMDMFDTIGTLVALTYRIGIVKENGEIPCAKETMLADAIGSTFGAILGCSTITTYLESASGVAEGGRSGLPRWSPVECSSCPSSSLPSSCSSPVLPRPEHWYWWVSL